MESGDSAGNPIVPSLGAILLVDDEEAVRRLLQTVLTDAGYDVTVAGDGGLAIELMRQKVFDAVVTDLVMPEMEGIDLIKALRTEHPDVHVIAMSGAFEGQFLPIARALGAKAILAKPFSPAALVATIKAVLAAA